MQESISIVLSGQAGQGLQTLENLLDKTIQDYYFVFSTKEVMSRVRGGNNTVEFRLSDAPIYAYTDTIDYLFLLNNHSFDRTIDRLSDKTLVFGEDSFIDPEIIKTKGASFAPLEINKMASDIGSILYANTVLYGYISGLLGLNQDTAHQLLSQQFGSKADDVIEKNLKAFDQGYLLGQDKDIQLPFKKTDKAKDLRLINATEAIGIGALAGGVNYVASYPMSPATGVLQYLADKGNDFGVVVEQAEDEIAALNMVLGGWYAGARALATTSGGGFALMEEAMSLSGITETPAFVHIAQRPGPGTGLPTRTAQEDLNLAIYSGHGEFPRLVYAPGHPADAIKLTQKGLYLADKYQIPVILLSDQYLLDSKGLMPPFDLDSTYLDRFTVTSKADYQRYKLTDTGISPRAIPGQGQGLVKVDSDEHTEDGMITEDFDVRIAMNNKRLGKEALLLEDAEPADLIGSPDYSTLVLGWGSTYGAIKEALTSLANDHLAYLYIKQVYPLHPDIKAAIDKADQVLVVENNATGQFSRLLKTHFNLSVDHQLLKHNGVPFTVEEIEAKLKEVL